MLGKILRVASSYPKIWDAALFMCVVSSTTANTASPHYLPSEWPRQNCTSHTVSGAISPSLPLLEIFRSLIVDARTCVVQRAGTDLVIIYLWPMEVSDLSGSTGKYIINVN